MNEPQKHSGDINKNDEVKTFKYLLLIKNKQTKKGKNCQNQLVQNSGNYSETCNNLGSIYSKKITWLSEEAVSIVEQSHYQTLLPICAVALKSNRKKTAALPTLEEEEQLEKSPKAPFPNNCDFCFFNPHERSLEAPTHSFPFFGITEQTFA